METDASTINLKKGAGSNSLMKHENSNLINLDLKKIGVDENFIFYISGDDLGLSKELEKNGFREPHNSRYLYDFVDGGDVVLDIGCNDGTLLKHYKKLGSFFRIGIDPALNVASYGKKNCEAHSTSFFNKKTFKKLSKNKKSKVITAIAMFYDLENPSKFVSDINDCLDDNGVFIAQLMCLESMLKKNDLGNICHEHLEFYSFKSLKYLFEKNGLKIFKIEENDINGGSYRIFCKKNISRSINYKEKASLFEIKKFIRRVESNK